MTICPCCGFRSESTLSVMGDGCQSCGARPVGEPLPRPEHELPSFGRSLVLTVMGSLMALTFLTQTFLSLTQRSSRGATSNLAFFSMIPLDFWSWVAAAETAAWQLKWAMIPVTLVVILGGRKLYRSIAQAPTRFCGVRFARAGFLASAIVPIMVVFFIGITVPERLRQREDGIQAGFNAQGYRIDRALGDYRTKFGTLPSELKDLSRLPDTDGSLAAALQNLDTSGYEARAEIASKQKPQPLRGTVIRNASLTITDDLPNEAVSFTNYVLPLAGADKVLGTEDDLIVRDGVISKASETPRRGTSGATLQTRKP